MPALLLDDVHCRDCGIDTVRAGETYMVRDELWPTGRSDGSPGPMDGTLCIACLERRLGRALVPGDFVRPPIGDDDLATWPP